MPKNTPKFDLDGKRFGKWVVGAVCESRVMGYYWLCQCDCGTQKFVRGQELLRGNSLSCGCNRGKPREKVSKQKQKTVEVQYRWWNKSRKKYDAWEYFGMVTEANAEKLLSNANKALQYRIRPEKIETGLETSEKPC